ncbi:hypothetical protein C9374_009252 [Naegleria lovaniensis]|uniref:ATP-grasp domain-containing protein n=1 Tax=Naegleria lovaniensis TaxID=51637 RepID=A0AA88GHM6_NAELO|nr:uncharacterized protein C9374_009252 [Naegleria lovaniensis]KAG2377341.1 hypothetical protein C9374_009252 [Naegleria lovaniensis]
MYQQPNNTDLAKENLLIHLDCPYSQELLLRVLTETNNEENSKFLSKYNIFTREDVLKFASETCEQSQSSSALVYEQSVENFIKHFNIHVQWDEYENIAWNLVMSHEPSSSLGLEKSKTPLRCNYYCVRKGLIRKAQFASVLNRYMTKKLDKQETTCLKRSIPETYLYELDDPEYFDESLYDIYEVVESLQENERKLQEGELMNLTTWILKPSITNKGAEIFIFNSLEALRNYFTQKHEQHRSEEEEDEEQLDEDKDLSSEQHVDLRQLREWVIQRYVDRPLLLCGGRKFHLRVYVVSVGALQVYVYDQILALFALRPFDMTRVNDTFSHITNTCVQVNEVDFKESESVKLFWNLDKEDAEHISRTQLERIFEQVKEITGETFAAVSGELNFMPLPHCFELYGLDFLVDENHQVYLLEVNAGPDFKQTGKELDSVIYNLFKQTAKVVLLNDTEACIVSNENPATFGKGQLHRVLSKETTYRNEF